MDFGDWLGVALNIVAPYWAVIFAAVSAVIVGYRKRRKFLKYFKKRTRRFNLYQSTVRYFERSNNIAILYKAETFGPHQVVPAVVAVLDHPLGANERLDPLIELIPGPIQEFPYRPEVIEELRHGGAKLHNGEILHLHDVVDSDGVVKYRVGRTRYFPYVDLSWDLRQELERERPTDHAMREFLLELTPLRPNPRKPQIVGCSCITIFRSGVRRLVAISNRSSSVANSPSVAAPIPSFGLEANARGGLESDQPLITYNFLREFGEELLGLEELNDMQDSPRTSPDWFMDISSIASVVGELEAGRLVLTCEAVSANPYDGALDFALLAEFSSEEFFRNIQRLISANWESQANSDSGAPPIEFIDLFDPRLDELVVGHRVDNCSVVALDRARLKLRSGVRPS